MSAAQVVEQFCKLPFEEQHEAYEKIREVVEDFDDELTPEQIAELERRAEELRQHPERGIPWETVQAELSERLKSRKA
jgi:putative addiction module component (TIGR02574 family)